MVSLSLKKLAPTKAETALLEPFVGLSIEQIFVPRKKVELKAATEEILAARIVGFDTESKPIFNSGTVSNGPHVVQFALESKAYLFQVPNSNCREFLMELLASEDLLKVGFGLASDRRQIRRKFETTLRGALDLNQTFRKAGYKGSVGVRAAVGVVLNQRFHKSKSITTSNWALVELTKRQRLYAANDAFAALMVQRALNLTPELLGAEEVERMVPALVNSE